MQMGKRCFCLVLLFAFCINTAQANKKTTKIIVENTENQVTFRAKVLRFGFDGVAKSAGTGSVEYWVEGEHHGVEGTVLVTMNKFKTGLDARDKHMEETLDVIGFPKAVLQFKGKDGSFSGSMLIKGKRNLIEGAYSLYPIFKLNFVLSLKTFGIEPPTFAKVVGLEDHVSVEALIKY